MPLSPPAMAKEKNSKTTVNFWAFLQNVAIHSMNKGQFPLACVAAIILLLIYKLPPQDAARLVDRILNNLTSAKGFAYVLCTFLAGGWAFHARWQRRTISAEMDRIGREKSQLQEQTIGDKLSHSKSKPKQQKP
jgi:hypothetical protein